ncbi:WAT1-related protein [Arachis hypogaea]|nr:WAT1-related protein [Arachis hypogaea]
MESVMTKKVKLLVALMSLQFCFAGYHIVSRLALNIGVSKVVYPVYRNIIALLLLSPLACFLENITANQGFYLLGLYYASPTLASAMQNSVPAITFVMASALGLEEVNIARIDGLAKILGTIASVGGATVITLYKGPPLLHLQTPQMQDDSYIHQSSTKVQNWTWGCVYLLGHCLSWAAWMVFQAPVVKKYPAKLSLTSFTFFFGLVQFLIIAAFLETDMERWKIISKEELLTILYASTEFIYVLMIPGNCIVWGCNISANMVYSKKGGPVCVAVFQPLQTFLVAIMAALILGDQLYSGGRDLKFLHEYQPAIPTAAIKGVDNPLISKKGNTKYHW